MSDRVRDPNSREAKLLACWKKYCRYGEDSDIPQNYINGWLDAYEIQQSLIDAKDAALKNRFCAGCNAVLSPTTMTQQYVDIIAVKDAEIVELRNLHKQTFMAGHEKIQTLTKERDDALARIEVQRVNIGALQKGDNV